MEYERKESLISNEKKCFVCEMTIGLHRHHIFGAANRKISDKQGCWVYLCGYHHNLSNQGVHNNRELDLKIKELCQERWEMINNANHDEFRRIFGRSYL